MNKAIKKKRFVSETFGKKLSAVYAILLFFIDFFLKTKLTVFNKQKFNFEDYQYFQI